MELVLGWEANKSLKYLRFILNKTKTFSFSLSTAFRYSMLKCDLNMNPLLSIVDFCGFLFFLNFSTQTHPICAFRLRSWLTPNQDLGTSCMLIADIPLTLDLSPINCLLFHSFSKLVSNSYYVSITVLDLDVWE